MIKRISHPFWRYIVPLGLSFLSAGCLARDLKRLEIKQLQAELTDINSTNAYLERRPRLNADYGVSAFISGNSLNDFLKGLDHYEIPLAKPKGAVITVDSVRLEFKDGAPTVVIIASATDRAKLVNIRLRIRTDLILTAEPAKQELNVGFQEREILPDVRLCIFRWREFWFAQAIMRLKAQQYIDSLPQVRLHLEPEFPVTVESSHDVIAKTNRGRGWIKLRINTPAIALRYKYRATRVFALKDGIHVFFAVERGS